jgi:hypothetical protein
MKKLITAAAALVALAVAGTCVLTHAVPAAGANPLATLSRAAPDHAAFRGRVQTRLSAGTYTYLELDDDRGAKSWVVTLGRGAPSGARVLVRSIGVAHDFHSRRLERTFPELTFGMVSRLD